MPVPSGAQTGTVVVTVSGTPSNGVQFVTPGTFAYTGSMNIERTGETVTPLPDGTVLLTGGNGTSGAVSSAEVYNPTAGTFALATGSMATARYFQTATLLNNGLVLIAGGGNSSGTTASAELYNPANQTFTPTGSMNVPRMFHTATLLSNGQVLIAGGSPGGPGLSSAELYNPSAGTFTLTGSLNTGRYNQAAILLGNGQVLILGGYNGFTGPISSAELYNPSAGTFSTTGSMNAPRQWLTPAGPVMLNNGSVLAMGGLTTGNSYLSSAELYNPSTGSFTLTGSMNVARDYFTATVLNNGLVLIAGSATTGGQSVASSEVYDPSLGTFTYTGSLKTARHSHMAALLNNGSVLIAGGYALTTSELYQITESPTITSLSQTAGSIGTSITITGTNFGTTQGTSTLTFNGATATPTSWSDTTIVVPVPTGATTGNVIVTDSSVSSNGVAFAVVAPPSISASVSPAPNAAGWINLTPTVTFTCTAGGLPIASCPSPQIVTTDGAGQIVSGTVTDTGGDSATASVTVNLDRTIPTLTVSSPADQTSESSSPVTVSGTLTDSLSGAAGVTCDGVAASQSGGSFSCTVSLSVGNNLVIVQGTDAAGNVAGDNFHLTLTGSLPAPNSLQVTPTGVNMVVGGTQQFTAVDDQGRPRADATWTVSSTSIATIDTNSSPALTAVATGQATLTATVGSQTAQTVVNVLSGTSLPNGTVIWSAPTASGFSNRGSLQTQPLDDGGPDVIVSQVGSSGQTVTGAYTNDGRQMWQTSTNDVFQGSVPSNDGGQVAAFFDQTSGYYMTKIDAATGKQVWQFPMSTNPISAVPWAVDENGVVYLLEPQFDPSSYTDVFPDVLALDGATGTVRYRVALPNSNYQWTHSGCSGGPADYVSSGPTALFGPPEIAEDGSLRIEFTVQNFVYTLTDVSDPYGFCDHLSVQYSNQLQLWTVQADGSYASSVVATSSGTVDCLAYYDGGSCPYHSDTPGEVIPDGSGGSLVSWKDETGCSSFYSCYAPDVFHISDVANGAVRDFTPSSIQPTSGYYSFVPLVLGDDNVVFASDGTHLAALDLSSETTNWTYTAPSGTSLNQVVSAAGGGLAAKATTAGVDTVLRFDSSGNLNTDSWSGTNLDYYIANEWFGYAPNGSGGSPLIAYTAPPVDLSDSIWFAFAMMGNRRAIQYLHVLNPSNEGPNQAVIVSVLQKIYNALPSYTSCNNWLQGAGQNAGTSGSTLIQTQIQNNTFGHGVFTIPGEAVSGGTNPDGSSIGVPSTYSFTVNDSGAFFNTTDAEGQQFKYGPNRYAGKTLKAQAAILLHEYGHQLTIGANTPQEFLKDFGISKANEFNNKLVNANCKNLIEGIQ